MDLEEEELELPPLPTGQEILPEHEQKIISNHATIPNTLVGSGRTGVAIIEEQLKPLEQIQQGAKPVPKPLLPPNDDKAIISAVQKAQQQPAATTTDGSKLMLKLDLKKNKQQLMDKKQQRAKDDEKPTQQEKKGSGKKLSSKTRKRFEIYMPNNICIAKIPSNKQKRNKKRPLQQQHPLPLLLQQQRQ